MKQRHITAIEAAAPAAPKDIRVAAYCRVSTLSSDQHTSIDNQREHYLSAIVSHTGWALAGIYLEEGITGTRKEIRPELNRMLSDCRAGKIDLILTKSISRFARNTTDCLEMVRTLTGLGIRIIFEKENLDTARMGSEFILTILSSLAEEESHSISDNEKWSIQKRFQDGTYHQSKAPYGFRWSNGTNGDLIPDPAESTVVAWIFDRVLDGNGTPWIARRLNSARISSPENKTWSARTVGAIVRNPAAAGDMLHSKTYRDREYRIHHNIGEKPMYYTDGHHAAIITKDAFQAANASLTQRGREKGNFPPDAEHFPAKNVRGSRYMLTGMLVCAHCGSPLRRVTQYTVSGPRIHWECALHYADRAACPVKRVLEENVTNAFLTLIRKLRYAPFILDDYCEALLASEKARQSEQARQITARLQENTEKRNRLTLLIRSGCAGPVFDNQVKLEQEAARLKEARNQLLSASENAAVRFRYFITRFDPCAEDVFPEEAFRQHVERVLIHSQTRYTFVLTCGLALTEDLASCAAAPAGQACEVPVPEPAGRDSAVSTAAPSTSDRRAISGAAAL